MQKLTTPLLRKLIDHIDVFETEGTGKNRTQRIVIYYRFIGYVAIPECYSRENYTPIYDKVFQSNTYGAEIGIKKSRHKVCSVHKYQDEKQKSSIHKVKSLMNTRFGPSDRVRTCGLMVPNHPRYQLRHTRLYLFFSLFPAY